MFQIQRHFEWLNKNPIQDGNDATISAHYLFKNCKINLVHAGWSSLLAKRLKTNIFWNIFENDSAAFEKIFVCSFSVIDDVLSNKDEIDIVIFNK